MGRKMQHEVTDATTGALLVLLAWVCPASPPPPAPLPPFRRKDSKRTGPTCIPQALGFFSLRSHVGACQHEKGKKRKRKLSRAKRMGRMKHGSLLLWAILKSKPNSARLPSLDWQWRNGQRDAPIRHPPHCFTFLLALLSNLQGKLFGNRRTSYSKWAQHCLDVPV